MRTFRPSMTGTGPSTAVASFAYLAATQATNWLTTEASRQLPISSPTRFGRLYMEVDVAPGAGNYWDMIVRRAAAVGAAADTLLKLRIADLATTGFDDRHWAYFNDGDRVSLEARPSTLDNAALVPAAPARVRWRYESESVRGFQMFFGTVAAHPGVAGGTAAFLVPGGGSSNWAVLNGGAGDPDLLAQFPCPINGWLRRIRIIPTSSPSPGTYALVVYVNGVASTLLATVTANAPALDDQDVIPVNKGDTISVAAIPSGAPAAIGFSGVAEFVPAIDGMSFLPYASSAAPASTAVRYEQLLGRGGVAWTATEADRQAPALATYTATEMLVKLGTAAGLAASGKKWRIGLRLAGADSALGVDLLETLTVNRFAAEVPLLDQGLVDLSSTPTGVPDALTNGVHVGVALRGPAGFPAPPA